MKSKESSIKRINRVIAFYHSIGQNRERVNLVYRKIINSRL